MLIGLIIGLSASFRADAATPQIERPYGEAVEGLADLSSRELAFFHLHQALGYLERGRQGKCPAGFDRLPGHLERVRALLGSLSPREKEPALEAVMQKLRTLAKRPALAPLGEIEKVRMQLYSLTLGKRYPHRDAWHAELERDCSAAPKTP
jgi:hypothetical protein